MFVQLLELESLSGDRFKAPLAPDKGERVYGGQYLAQSIAAASATLASERRLHSLHAYFLRPGDVDLETELAVERVRDGRSFSSRQVTARQSGREVFRMMSSYQVPDASPEYSAHRMPDVPPPEAVALTYNEFTLAQTGEATWHGFDRPMDIRYINPPRARGEAVTEPQLMWMRIPESLPDTAHVHDAGIAYLSDSALIDHVMLPFGLRWQDADFLGASIDHAMWFHAPARADEWLLFVQTAEATGGGRGLATGRIFTQSGTHVTTCTQEGLVRWVSDGRA